MSYIRITVESGKRSCSCLVPIRDAGGVPLRDLDILDMLRGRVVDLFWQSLGYPAWDILEMGDPWRGLEDQKQSDPAPSSVCVCGHAWGVHSGYTDRCALCDCEHFVLRPE